MRKAPSLALILLLGLASEFVSQTSANIFSALNKEEITKNSDKRL